MRMGALPSKPLLRDTRAAPADAFLASRYDTRKTFSVRIGSEADCDFFPATAPAAPDRTGRGDPLATMAQ